MANYRMRMKADNKTGEILIYDDIGASWFGGISAKQFADDLKALGSVDTLLIRVNSPGGDVFDALAIYNTLRRHGARKEISIDGMALSAATLICCAGDVVSMADNAMYMIHDPWAVTMGNAADMREQADLLDDVKDNIVTTYMRRTQGDENNIRQLMADETWFKPQQALESGFVDMITGELAVAARFDPSRYRFKNIPADIRAKAMRNLRSATPRLDAVRSRMAEQRARASLLAA